MKETERPLIIFDLDDVIVSWGFFFKKGAKIALEILFYVFDLKIVTSRGIFSYLVAVVWLWLNNINIPIERSGPNGNKAKHCQKALMFVDNDPKHILNVLESGGVEKVCFFPKNGEAEVETDKKIYIVYDWWDILWVALAQ